MLIIFYTSEKPIILPMKACVKSAVAEMQAKKNIDMKAIIMC